MCEILFYFSGVAMNLSVILPVLVTGAGLFFIFELRGFFILHPRRTMSKLSSSFSDRAGFKAFSLALAGTLGVGNIFGVAAGIIIGGAGSVLWLFVSSVFAMVIKYAETTLAADNAADGYGGMHVTLCSVFSRAGRPLSVIYAALCLLLALFMGFCLQSASVITVARISLGIPAAAGAFVLVILLIPSVIYGGSKIERFTAFAIPLTTVVYIIMTFAAIFVNIGRLPQVINDIVCSAASPLAAGGGALSFLSSSALREGYSRGILSNEAGAGTSAMAHSRASDREPAVAGLYGMCEVFFDTLLLCTLTALAILTAVPDYTDYHSPMSLVSDAFTSSLGDMAGIVLFLCIFLFAYSTVVCWFYYGSECAKYLFGARSRWVFFLFFIVFVSLGARGEMNITLVITDFALLIMSVITLLTLVRCSDKIRALTEAAGLLVHRKYKKK